MKHAIVNYKVPTWESHSWVTNIESKLIVRRWSWSSPAFQCAWRTWETIHPFSEEQRNLHYCLVSTNMFIFLNFMYLNIILIILKKFWGKGVFKVSFFLNLLVLHTWLFKIKLVILIMRNNELITLLPRMVATHPTALSLIYFFRCFFLSLLFWLVFSFLTISYIFYHQSLILTIPLHHLIQSTFSSWI